MLLCFMLDRLHDTNHVRATPLFDPRGAHGCLHRCPLLARSLFARRGERCGRCGERRSHGLLVRSLRLRSRCTCGSEHVGHRPFMRSLCLGPLRRCLSILSHDYCGNLSVDGGMRSPCAFCTSLVDGDRHSICNGRLCNRRFDVALRSDVHATQKP